MKSIIVNPVGLKGNQVNERIKELMGVTPINESLKNSVVELTKIGPDGNVYAIVRENHEYYIKTTSKKDNLVAEDFGYIGGLQNKKDAAYPSYAKAIKHLNIKFNSLAEAYGKNTANFNIFENDNAYDAGSVKPEDQELTEETVDENAPVEEDVELTEDEAAIDDMVKEDSEMEECNTAPMNENKKLSIARSINGMDDIIDDIVRKKKTYRII